jgi:hypothetical protein
MLDARIGTANPFNNQEPLSVLIIRIRDEHLAAQAAESSALDHALNAGIALLAAQRQVQGPWKKWIAANLSISVSCALTYMQLARHRSQIEDHPNRSELSIRRALGLIAKSRKKSTSGTQEKTVSLLELWNRAGLQDRQKFCDAVGVVGFREIWSLNFYRTLLNSVRTDKVEADPNSKMTITLKMALSLLTSIDDPNSSNAMRSANTYALLMALRTFNKTLRAAGDYKDIAVSIVDADRNRKKKRAA